MPRHPLAGSVVVSMVGTVAVCAVTAWDVAGRLRGQLVRPRQMLVLPAAAVAWTAWQVWHAASAPGQVTGVEVVLLVVEAVVAIVLGGWRGVTVAIIPIEGHAAQRYRGLSLGLWLVLCLLGGTLALLAQLLGARLAAGTNAVMVLLSLSDLAELAIALPRTRASGLPLAPEPHDQAAAKNHAKPSRSHNTSRRSHR